MARIRAKDTRPEMLVRRFLHACGYRYRLHDRRLPGSPDIVLPRWRAGAAVWVKWLKTGIAIRGLGMTSLSPLELYGSTQSQP